MKLSVKKHFTEAFNFKLDLDTTLKILRFCFHLLFDICCPGTFTEVDRHFVQKSCADWDTLFGKSLKPFFAKCIIYLNFLII